MANKIEVTPAQAITANGSVAANIPYMNSFGAITAVVTGTFGSGTAKLEFTLDGINWVDSGITGLTAAGALKMTGVACKAVRVVVTGSTTPTISVVFAY
jgi:hypothetical protein